PQGRSAVPRRAPALGAGDGTASYDHRHAGPRRREAGRAGRLFAAGGGCDGCSGAAQLSVGIVDEALYGVRPDTTPDPLRFFYRREYNQVSTSFSRQYSFVGHSGTEQLLLARRRRPMTLADFKADRPDRPR